jgi:hypothetical protein
MSSFDYLYKDCIYLQGLYLFTRIVYKKGFLCLDNEQFRLSLQGLYLFTRIVYKKGFLSLDHEQNYADKRIEYI